MHVPCPPPTRCPTTLTHYAQSQCEFRRALVQRDYFSMTYLHWLKLVKQRGLPSKYLSTCIIIIVMFCATNHAQKTALARGCNSICDAIANGLFLYGRFSEIRKSFFQHFDRPYLPCFMADFHQTWSKVAMGQPNYVTLPTWSQRSSEVN